MSDKPGFFGRLFSRGSKSAPAVGVDASGFKTLEEIIKASTIGRDDRRVDMGAPPSLSKIQGYYAEAREILSWNATDPLFTSLSARVWEHGNTRADWVISPTGDKSRNSEQAEIEQEFWNLWSATINQDLNNIIDGMDTVNQWIFKRLVHSSMAVAHWEWGNIPFRGKMVWAPVKMKIEPSLAIRFTQNPKKLFGQETTWLYNPVGKGDVPSGYSSGRASSSNITEAQYSANTLRKDPNWKALRPSTSFAIKLDWVPDDDRVVQTIGSYAVTPTDLPNIRWISLEEPMRLRRILRRGDLAILDGLINYVIHWSVGNSDTDEKGRLINQPRPKRVDANGATIEKSTIEQVKELIQTDTLSKAMELVLPYWINFDIKTPDSTMLLNVEKYFHATQCVFEGFGIYTPSTRMGGQTSSPKGTGDDRANFVNYVENIRQHHVSRFWEMMARRIKEHDRNRDIGFKFNPKYVFRSLRLKTDEYRAALSNVTKMGLVSMESLHRAYGLHPRAEMDRIKREIGDGTMDDINKHVPVQFSQETVNPSGKTTKVDDAKDNSRGRPKSQPTKE
jgi:hypothetical protein